MIHDTTLCQLGEGPLWHPTRAQLFWFDILGHQLHTKGRSWDFDTYVSAAGWIDDDTLLIASARALHRFDITSGKTEDICPLEADNPLTRSNDGRADPCGGFWIGTMGINATPNAGTIYRFYRGEIRQLFQNITISNAICFAPDGNTAYFADTPDQQIMRISLDSDGWPTGSPAVHIDLRGTDFHPDGAVVDRAGNLFNAQWGAARIAAYDTRGRFIDAFTTPAAQTSCPAFGGPDLQTLFATTAATGRDGPNDGQTYRFDTGFTGQAEHRVIL